MRLTITHVRETMGNHRESTIAGAYEETVLFSKTVMVSKTGSDATGNNGKGGPCVIDCVGN